MVVQDWASVIVSSLVNLWSGFIGTLWVIIGALIVLVVGLIVASGIGALVERLVRLAKLDKFLVSLGLKSFFDRAGMQINSSHFLGKLVYWFFVVLTLLVMSNVLGFYSLSNFLNAALLYVPNVIAAVLIMLAAFVLGNFLRHIVRASVKSAELNGSHFLSSLTWWAVVVFGFLAALQQLGIASAIIQSLVTGIVAMIAIGGGIAFGLGGKGYAETLIGRLKDRLESH